MNDINALFGLVVSANMVDLGKVLIATVKKLTDIFVRRL